MEAFLECLRSKASDHGLEILDHNSPINQDALIVRVRRVADDRTGYVTASGRELRLNQPKTDSCPHCGGRLDGNDGAMASLVEARIRNALHNMAA